MVKISRIKSRTIDRHTGLKFDLGLKFVIENVNFSVIGRTKTRR